MTEKLINVETIGSHFESLSDPRHARNRKHLLVDILVISICGIVRGCDGPTAIHRWATNRQTWLTNNQPRIAPLHLSPSGLNRFAQLFF